MGLISRVSSRTYRERYPHQKIEIMADSSADTTPPPPKIKKWHEKNFFEKVYWYYMQYCLSLCLTMLEPWERYTFNFVIMSIILAISYTACTYVPIHFQEIAKIVGVFLHQKVGGGEATSNQATQTEL